MSQCAWATDDSGSLRALTLSPGDAPAKRRIAASWPRSVGGGAAGFGLGFEADRGPLAYRLGSAWAADGVAQMCGAVAQRGLHGQTVDGGAEHRFPKISLEAVLQQIGGAVGA